MDVKKITHNENFLPILSMFILCILYTYKFLFTNDTTVPYASDYNMYPMYTTYQRDTIFNFGQFPLWANMHQMGYPLYADWTSNIYYPLATPFFFVFGGVQGLKIIIFIHIFLSGIGFWFYSKLLTKNRLACYFGAMLFMLCGALACRIEAGHLNHILPFPWIPISMYFLHKTIDTRQFKYLIYSAISISFFVLASIALFVFFIFLFAVFAFFQIVWVDGKKIKIDKHQLYILTIIGILAIMIASIKLIPILAFSGGSARPHAPLYASVALGDIISSFVDKTPVSEFPVGTAQQTSYYYIGIIALLFVPFSILHKSGHRKYLIVSGGIFTIWAMGYFTPFGVVHLFPVLQNLSVPPRSLILLSFCLISLIVMGFDWLMEKYNTLSVRKKKYVLLFFGSIIAITFFEMTSPLVFNLLFPENYDAYVYFTGNEFTITTLIVSVIALFVMLLTIKYGIKKYKFRFILQLRKNFVRRMCHRLLTKKVMSIMIVTFVIVNLLVTNSALFKTRQVWYHDERLEDQIAEDIENDNPNSHPWIRDDYRGLVNHHLMSGKVPTYSAGVAGFLRYNAHYLPEEEIVIGNMIYTPFNYKITDVENLSDATVISTYTVKDISAHDKDSQFTGGEPKDISEIFSKTSSKNETQVDNVTLYLYRMNNSLPDVFIVRDTVVIPLEVTRLTPLEIVARADTLIPGDVVVFKNTYYPGWKYVIGNTKTVTENYQRLNSFTTNKDYRNVSITFVFEPNSFKVGIIVTLFSLLMIVILHMITKFKWWKLLR